MLTDVSIDLETWGTDPGSVIVQVGLCCFNALDKSVPLLNAEYHIDAQSCLDHGMTISASTILWWMEQEDRARERLIMGQKEGLRINDVVHGIMVTLGNLSPNYRVWGNGSSFDVTLIEDLFRKIHMRVPWSHRDIMDMRTIVWIADNPELRVKPGLKHSAVSDAVAQAKTIQNCVEYIGGPRGK